MAGEGFYVPHDAPAELPVAQRSLAFRMPAPRDAGICDKSIKATLARSGTPSFDSISNFDISGSGVKACH